MLNERKQAQKATDYIIPFILHSGKGSTTDIENRSELGLGEGLSIKGNENIFRDSGTFQYLDCHGSSIWLYAFVKSSRSIH